MSESLREAIIDALNTKSEELKVLALDYRRNADLYDDRASMFEVAAVIAKTTADPTPPTERNTP